MAKQTEGQPTPAELISKAIAEAGVKSGASHLPNSGNVPEAYALGEVPASAVLMPPEISNDIYGMGAALAENPNCPPHLKAQQQEIAKALACIAPQAPPVQVGIAGSSLMIPGSVRAVPNQLHATNTTKAKMLWDLFVNDEKQTIARLASQSGLTTKPFVYLAQAIAQLLFIDYFKPKAIDGSNAFHVLEGDPQNPFYQGLSAWAGPELTRQIVAVCKDNGVSVIDGLKQMYKRLAEKQVEALNATQLTETIGQWT